MSKSAEDCSPEGQMKKRMSNRAGLGLEVHQMTITIGLGLTPGLEFDTRLVSDCAKSRISSVKRVPATAEGLMAEFFTSKPGSGLAKSYF